MSFRTLLPAALLAVGACLAAHAAPPAKPQPVEDFFDNAEFGGAQLSPSGRYLAAKVNKDGGRDKLAVVDLVTLQAQGVAGFGDSDIGDFQWVNDGRLLFDTADKELAGGEMRHAPGLFAVDRNGKHFIQLAQRTGSVVRLGGSRPLLPWHTYMFDRPGAQDSDTVHVQDLHFSGNGSVEAIELVELNTRTGGSMELPGPANVLEWVLDARGQPRMAIALEKGQKITWLLENGAWRALSKGDAYLGEADRFSPLAFDGDGRLYVEARNGDKKALYTFDLATGKPSAKPVFEMDRYDFSGHLIQRSGKLAGIRYLGEAWETYWFDPGLKALQAEIDAKLPGMVNLVDVPRRPETPFVLVRTYSDLQPEITLVYNRETGKFSQVGKAHPRIRPSAMGSQEIVWYPARDGLPIPALLTLPPGPSRQDIGKDSGKDGKLPMVVLVHGGPWVRAAEFGWSADAQFLASRGYAVLEPDFRGSTGYGARHFSAGVRQWGLAMQDDVADGTRWAIREGFADPQRICIAGASYGGYATLMGLIRDPDLYRCGVAWVGVADIKLMYDNSWFNLFNRSDMSDQYIQYGMPQLVGDPVKDADQLKATSPVEQAGRLKQPLLLAHGGADRRVPLAHGTRFRDAVRATNKQVEWVEYPEEGHGWKLPATRVDFWTRVEKFLDKNIGAGSVAADGKAR